MELRSVQEVKKMNKSRYITIPFLMARKMGLEIGDYINIEYDEEKNEMKIKKS